MADKIQIRRDSRADWVSNDPTLSAGELGLVEDTGELVPGDGSTSFGNLDSYWQTWSPTLTNLTEGNGTEVARYVRQGKTVHCYYSLTFGSTSSISGIPEITLPVTGSSNYIDFMFIGQAFMRDDSGNIFQGVVRFNSTARNEVQVMALDAASADVFAASTGSGSPFTWTTSDVLAFYATYEAA